MKIGFTVDNPKRDLKGIILITKHLLEKNHDVILFPMKYVSIDSIFSGIDVMVFNYIRPNNINLIKKLRFMGIKIFILDTEGGVVSENGLDSPKNWAKSFKDLKYYKYVDGYFFWGESIYKAFKDYSGIKDERLYLTGCPRYDQCHPRWSTIQEPRNIQHILINTNFSSINPSFSSNLEEEKIVMINTGWEKTYVEKLFNEMSKTLIKMLHEIKVIADSFPLQKFIVRPHPFENKYMYEDKFINQKNIIIDAEGDIFDAILGARCILHLNCGTSVDSYLSGVPPVSIEYLNTTFLSEHTPLPSKTSYCAYNLSDIKEIITNPNKALNYLERANVYKKYIEPFFYNPDGRASERIANILDKSSYESSLFPTVSPIKTINKDISFSYRIYSIFCLIFGTKFLSKIREIYSQQKKYKDFDIKRLKFLYSKINIDSNTAQFSHEKTPYTLLKNTAISIRSNQK